jgi:tRNA U34 5-methylaminomethyl-2-thiouridine-forming methyltransferase MnmC
MKKILTNDGSVTFHNEHYNETYHSVSGALEESFKKYIEPCKIKNLAKKGNIRVLDICFGLGYNTLAAIFASQEENKESFLDITALEKDAGILRELQAITLSDDLEFFYSQIKEQVEKPEILICNKEKKECARIKIILGDAASTISSIQESFDAVFLDPFSPKKNPELWTLEFFKQIKRLVKKNAVLATYSCARIVRENLRDAGFAVSDGPIVGRKAPATIAFWE